MAKRKAAPKRKVERHSDGITPKIPKQSCLRCGYDQDAASETTLGKRAPKVGDISLCLNCGHAAQFGPGMVQIEISPKVWRELEKEPAIMHQITEAKRYAIERGIDLRPGRA